MLKKLKNISKKTLLIILGFTLGAGFSAIAITYTEWTNTEKTGAIDWIVDGAEISSEKLVGTFNYLFDIVQENQNRLKFKADKPTDCAENSFLQWKDGKWGCKEQFAQDASLECVTIEGGLQNIAHKESIANCSDGFNVTGGGSRMVKWAGDHNGLDLSEIVGNGYKIVLGGEGKKSTYRALARCCRINTGQAKFVVQNPSYVILNADQIKTKYSLDRDRVASTAIVRIKICKDSGFNTVFDYTTRTIKRTGRFLPSGIRAESVYTSWDGSKWVNKKDAKFTYITSITCIK